MPQGSVVGPLLFVIQFDGLLLTSDADDINLTSQDESLTENGLMKIQDWCAANKLFLNLDKTLKLFSETTRKDWMKFQLSNVQPTAN